MIPIRQLDLAATARGWLPLALWLALWLSISPGSIQGVLHPDRIIDFVHGFRGLLPFIAAGISVLALAIFAWKRNTNRRLFTGPLGFVFLYAAVGLIATLNSVDRSQSLYWAGSYIAVPLVLWTIGSGSGALERARRTLDITSLVMVLAAVALVAFAFIKLDLLDAVLHPEILAQCSFGNAWFTETSGVLRSTGVGRYAAVASLVAIAGIAHGRWRLVWCLILLATLMLLVSSGARTAFVSFAVASVMMAALYGGRKPILIGLGVLVLAISLFWAANGDSGALLRDCFGINSSSGTPKPNDTDTPITVVQTPTQIPTQAPIQTEAPASLPPKVSPGPTVAVSAPDPTATAEPGDSSEPISPAESADEVSVPLVSFSGRTEVWVDALSLVKKSPLIGYGFNADRILLNAHTHNSFIHALIQTGALGTLALLTGVILAWLLLLKALRGLGGYSKGHRTRIVLAGGMLAFFSIRSIPESTGAFFGIDLLLLAPIVLYLSMVTDSGDANVESPA
ncbi:MAG: O-antigen ligase family protein [Chloroflexi bacterium]|nr:O-antigen ligase family protein [Chloroflexota bacterium]